MKLFFWQNINSMHQSAFFRALVALEGVEVTLIVSENISDFRLKMGWELPIIEGLTIHTLSKDNLGFQHIIDFNSQDEAFHIFSGINAFPKIHDAFLYAIKSNCKVGVFTEPYDFRGVKGFLRNLRGYYYSWKFQNKIAIVLVTGKNGCRQFKNWGYKTDKIFEWAYTVEKSVNVIDTSEKLTNPVFKIMFAGSLIPRKGYDILIEALKITKADDLQFHADFYCLSRDDDKKGEKIIKESNLETEISFLPFLPNTQLRCRMNQYDLFVLPSRHDGWGAVISESLSEGTPVVVSSKCGSSTLINNSLVGIKMNELDKNELAKSLKHFIRKGKVNFKERLEIRNWYNKKVSGECMANYLLDIISFAINEDIKLKPKVTWE